MNQARITKKKCSKEDFELLEQIGDGSFGSVFRAKRKSTSEMVAIKVMKKKINRNQSESSISECKLLKRIPFHLNIVRLYDTFSTPTKDFYCVMEYMNGGNLYQLIQERRESNKSINLTETKSIMYQIFKALSHIHQHGIFHRDMKPENLLINDEGTGNIIIKLGDFGLAREFKSRLPYTDYVSTRWYRAPEVLLKATTYTSAIDLWAVGTIFAEIITLRPIFPGQSELDQLFRICQVLGSPGLMIQKRKSKSDRLNAGFMSSKTISTEYVGIGGPWKEGLKLAQKHGFQFPEIINPPSIEQTLSDSDLPDEGFKLLKRLLQFDPCRRISSDDALLHPFFHDTSMERYQSFNLPIIPLSPLHVDCQWEFFSVDNMNTVDDDCILPPSLTENEAFHVINNLSTIPSRSYSINSTDQFKMMNKSLEDISMSTLLKNHPTLTRPISFPSIYNHSISISLEDSNILKRSVSESTLSTNIEVNIQHHPESEAPQLQHRKANKLKLWVEKYGFSSVFHGGKSLINA